MVTSERGLAIAAIAHDLGASAAAIRMTTASLLAHGGLTDYGTNALAQIDTSAAAIAQLVARLIERARRVELGLEAPSTEIDLRDVLAEVVNEAQLAFVGREIRVVARRPVLGRWDAVRVRRVLQNLLWNALAHGTPHSAVRAELRIESRTCVIAVTNRGVIARRAQRRLFTPFGRARRGGSHVGLGLYIARSIVEWHGGTIRVTSSATRGTTTVTVRLPRAPLASPER
jgi:signal transduction histidine kinase